MTNITYKRKHLVWVYTFRWLEFVNTIVESLAAGKQVWCLNSRWRFICWSTKKKTKRINWEWNELWKLWKWRIFSNKTTFFDLFQIVLEIKYINSWAYENNSRSNYHCIFHHNLKNWLFIYLTLINFCYYSRHEQFNIQLHSLISILSLL